MLRVVIIDDEPPARDDLRRLLLKHSNVTIVGEAGRIAEAATLLARGDYDLAFLDVQLRGGTGFDLLPQVRPEARIIFVTGYERFALRAFEVNALDYLLKPVEPARLAASLARVTSTAPAAASPPAASLTLDDSVFLKIDAGTARLVKLRDISVIFSSENYTELHLTDPARLIVRRTLKAWEEQLPSSEFMRVHRTAIVNLRSVKNATHHDREVTHLFIEGRPQQPVRARRELWPEIESRLTSLTRRS